jgi:hypothetical protein
MYAPFNPGVDRVIETFNRVVAAVPFIASLPHEHIAWENLLSSELFDS